MRANLLIFLLIFLLISCEEKKKSPAHITIKQPLLFDGLIIQPKLVNNETFLSGDKIPYARTAIEWRKAIELEQPAWCYSDKLNKTGVLYNYYAVSDKRGIQKDVSKLTPQKAAKLLSPKEIKWNQLFGTSDCTEKGIIGNVYNLNYINLWILDTVLQGKLSPCLVIDYKTNQVIIKNLNKGNGFYLLDIN